MTIAERKAREAYDRENPWRQTSEAKPSRMICEGRASHTTGLADLGAARFFLHDDGRWYRIDPPSRVGRVGECRLTEYRPTGVMLSELRRASIVRRATLGSYEFRGGQLYPRPKSYKLYWRADD